MLKAVYELRVTEGDAWHDYLALFSKSLAPLVQSNDNAWALACMAVSDLSFLGGVEKCRLDPVRYHVAFVTGHWDLLGAPPSKDTAERLLMYHYMMRNNVPDAFRNEMRLHGREELKPMPWHSTVKCLGKEFRRWSLSNFPRAFAHLDSSRAEEVLYKWFKESIPRTNRFCSFSWWQCNVHRQRKDFPDFLVPHVAQETLVGMLFAANIRLRWETNMCLVKDDHQSDTMLMPLVTALVQKAPKFDMMATMVHVAKYFTLSSHIQWRLQARVCRLLLEQGIPMWDAPFVAEMLRYNVKYGCLWFEPNKATIGRFMAGNWKVKAHDLLSEILPSATSVVPTTYCMNAEDWEYFKRTQAFAPKENSYYQRMSPLVDDSQRPFYPLWLLRDQTFRTPQYTSFKRSLYQPAHVLYALIDFEKGCHRKMKMQWVSTAIFQWFGIDLPLPDDLVKCVYRFVGNRPFLPVPMEKAFFYLTAKWKYRNYRKTFVKFCHKKKIDCSQFACT